jgi:hypothetical protein
VVEKLYAGGPGEDGHPESDFDVGELSGGEDLLAADGRGLGDLKGERPRVDAHPEIEGTGVSSFLGEADGIDGRPLQGNRGTCTPAHLVCATQLGLGGCRRAWPPSARAVPGIPWALATRHPYGMG